MRRKPGQTLQFGICVFCIFKTLQKSCFSVFSVKSCQTLNHWKVPVIENETKHKFVFSNFLNNYSASLSLFSCGVSQMCLTTCYSRLLILTECTKDNQCANGKCLLPSWRCDGVDQCGDMTDEKDCTKVTSKYIGGKELALLHKTASKPFTHFKFLFHTRWYHILCHCEKNPNNLLIISWCN
jgi:hypothetical protein